MRTYRTLAARLRVPALLAALALSVPALGAAPSAQQLMLVGRLNEALPAARLEAEADPTDVVAQERYIDLLLTLGYPSAAVQVCRSRVASHPSAPDSHYLLGRALPTADEARVAYERALKLDPTHARAHMGMGAVYRSTGRFPDAEAAYMRALERDSTLGEAWSGLGYALLAQGRSADALAVARKAVESTPDDADAWLTLAVLAPAEAEALLTEAASRFPADPRVHVALAEVRLSQGQGKPALASARAALQLDPIRSDALLAQSFAEQMASGTLDSAGYHALLDARRLETTSTEDATRAYDDLIARYAKCPLPLMARGRLRAKAGDTAGAQADLGRAVALDPDSAEAQGAYGLLLLEAGKSGEARSHLEKAARARPDDSSLAVAAAMAIAGDGALAEARKRMAAASVQWPYDARIALTYAKLLSDAGEPEAAYDVLKEAVARLPDGRIVLALAAAAKDTGRYAEAADLLDEVGRQTGNATFTDLARKLRELDAAAPKTTPGRKR